MASESDWVVKAMVAVAASDGRLDTREIALIQQVYQISRGETLTADEVARAATANAGSDTLGDLAAAAPELGMAEKEDILRAAYLVLLADARIAGEERKKLHDIAAALKIPEIHVSAILEDVDVSALDRKA